MKDIKFRAWDKKNKEWYMNGNVFDLNYSGSYGDFFFDNDHPCNMRDVDLEWLQFTGIKDKNGKEIFSGDIIRFADRWEWYRSGGRTRKEIEGDHVKFPYEERVVEIPDCYEWLLSSEIQEYWEVIGNIHE